MLRVKEAIVVEGRYDKNTLSQLVDGVILETRGFGIFKDGERLALLRRLAAEQGQIVLTDSDGAGFVIRNYLKGAIDPALVKHAYIPDRYGKERRKRAPGREGKLGVEGMSPAVLEEAQGRPVCRRPLRRPRRGGAPTEPAPGAGFARAHERQCYAGGAQYPLHLGGIPGDGGPPVAAQPPVAQLQSPLCSAQPGRLIR